VTNIFLIFSHTTKKKFKNIKKNVIDYYGSPFLTSIMWMKRGMILLCSSWMKKWDGIWGGGRERDEKKAHVMMRCGMK
jgi:hypothetical protein